MSQRFAGKTALVTGGSAGIGRAIVERLCAEGCRVTLSGLSDDGSNAENELHAKGYAVQLLLGDMGEESFCRRLVEAAAEKWGGIDYLVNNAFSFIAKGMDAGRADWDRSMRVGPIAYATMGQLVLPQMRKRGGGAIVNVSSISAHIAQPNRWTYNTAKGAVNELTRCMALDFSAFNVRVNTLSPGWIWTREVDKAAGGDRARWGSIWGRFHMLRRLGTVEECAAACAFLLSDDAGFITAAELPVARERPWAGRR